VKIDWTILNAYVDGELDAARAAAVAAAIAASPELAARTASLNRLKAATAQLQPAALPAHGNPARGRRPALRPAAIAAALAMLVAVAALGLWQPWRGGDPAWLVEAVGLHERWLADGAADHDGAVAAALPALARLAPDLGDAKLHLTHAERLADGDFFGYVGIHGCHVGLWTGPAEAAGADSADSIDVGAPRPMRRDAVHAFAWTDRGRRHLLMAHGMPDARLGRLAGLVAEILRRDRRLDEPLRLALQETAGMAPPCA
jgi:hypothetical protein